MQRRLSLPPLLPKVQCRLRYRVHRTCNRQPLLHKHRLRYRVLQRLSYQQVQPMPLLTQHKPRLRLLSQT